MIAFYYILQSLIDTLYFFPDQIVQILVGFTNLGDVVTITSMLALGSILYILTDPAIFPQYLQGAFAFRIFVWFTRLIIAGLRLFENLVSGGIGGGKSGS